MKIDNNDQDDDNHNDDQVNVWGSAVQVLSSTLWESFLELVEPKVNIIVFIIEPDDPDDPVAMFL